MSRAVSRRDVTRWMLSASIGGLAAAKLRADVTVFPGAASKVDFEPVRRRILQTVAGGDATGVAVAVVQDGRIVWEEGFGWADQKAGVKATQHTPFTLASITKPFTATTLMTLVAEGRLSLDEPANRYLRGCKLVGTSRTEQAVKVRQLGAHVSGLPGMYESYEVNEAGLVLSPEALLRAYGRLAYPPAAGYEYSNIGFAALHAVASGLTETEFGLLMHRRVLAPLGLNDSFFGSDTVRVQSGAMRYDSHGRLIPYYTTSTPASGELYASAHDLALFALLNMHRGAKGQSAVLSAQSIEELQKPVFTGPSGVATTFGWFRSETASGVPFFFKTGGDPGVANRMCFVPSKGLACVVVTNRSNTAELAYSVCDEVLAKYLPDWRRPEEDCGLPAKSFVATPEWKGRWRGLLEGGGAKMPIELDIESDDAASLAIGGDRAEAITRLRSEGEAFTGLSTGKIDAPDAVRTGARTLQIKLVLREDRVAGRVLAVAGDPNVKNVSLPFVITLSRR
ncbi:serine hydrolase domain-containing protein [Granulicella arctica]|uniref:serine hydrolase domain-containing protein n=1 Tax=Granulicella arctica TaxID=940613 RepID=UPI0021DFE3F9|nr:serine hydrolase domain-containing protein [Granulicella arctica]